MRRSKLRQSGTIRRWRCRLRPFRARNRQRCFWSTSKGEIEERTVTTGLETAHVKWRSLSGLSEGDTVMIGSRSQVRVGSKSTRPSCLSRAPATTSNRLMATPLTAEQLQALRSLSTCAVANAIETLKPVCATKGFPGLEFGPMFPQQKPVVGYAVTVKIRSSSPPPEGHNYLEHTEWWNQNLKSSRAAYGCDRGC